MKKITTALALIVSSVCIMVSCSKKDSSKLPDFDRKAMLQNFAENIINPSFTDLQITVAALKSATDAFTTLPNDANLTTAQTAWDAAYCSWMYANSFNFGPAGEEGIRKSLVEEIGTWPADVATIETNIINGNTTLNDFKRDNRGFNAVEYLLFANGNNSNTVTAFTTNTNRKIYLTALVNKLKMQVEQVATAWTGNYTTSFINNAGTDVGSSTAQMYNEFVRSFENIKNFKIGLPLGKRIGLLL